MSRQCYECPQHGLFEVTQPICDPVLPFRACPAGVGIPDFESDDKPITLSACGKTGKWRPSAPAVVIVEGGSGAGRLMNQRRNDERERFREQHKLDR